MYKFVWLYLSAFGIMFAILSWCQESGLLSKEIGFGKGFYDRSLAFRGSKTTPQFIGCAYDFQEVSLITLSLEPIIIFLSDLLTNFGLTFITAFFPVSSSSIEMISLTEKALELQTL